MKKPTFLKWSYIKNSFYKWLLKDIEYLSANQKHFTPNSILIVVGGGLGDNLVFYPVIEHIIKSQKFKKVSIAMEDKWQEVYKILKIDSETYTYCNNFFKRVLHNRSFFKKLNKNAYETVLYLGGYDNLHSYIANCYSITGSGVQQGVDKKTKQYTASYVLEELRKLYFNTTQGNKINLKDFYFTWPYQQEAFNETILFGIGAAGKHKMFDINVLAELLRGISKVFSEKNIILLGNGEWQERYAEKVLEEVGSSNIISKVNQLSLKESLTYVNSGYLFIGVDSALYNAAALFGKKTIGLFPYLHQGYEHSLDNVVVVKGKSENSEIKSEYGTMRLNSIESEDLLEAYKLLKIGK